MSIAREIQLRLKSGNAVPVHSCRITLAEFMELCREVREDEARRPRMPTVGEPRAQATNSDPALRTGLVARLYDSAQLSVLPPWCRKLLEQAADELSQKDASP